MPLQRQLLPIQIGGGIDTKTDDKKVVASKLITLENGVFTKPGQISKRNGYEGLPLTISGGGTITNPKAAKAYNDELVCAAENSLNPGDGRLFSFSGSLQAWVDKGKYLPSKVTTQTIAADTSQRASSGYSLGNYVVSAWAITQNPLSPASVYYVVTDTQNNEPVISETFISADVRVNNSGSNGVISGPLVMALGSSTLGIFYVQFSTGNLVVRVVTISGTTVSLGAEVVIQASVKVTFGSLFAVVNTPTGAAVIYSQTTPEIDISLINTAGSVTSTATVVLSNSESIYLSRNPFNGSFWVYWNAVGGGGAVSYAVFSSSLAVVLAATATGFSRYRFVSVSNSSTQQTVYSGATTGASILALTHFTVTSAGVVGSSTQFAAGGIIFSDTVAYNGRNYLPLWYPRSSSGSVGPNGLNVEQSFVLMDVLDGNVVATGLPGSASLVNTIRFGHIYSPFTISTGKIGIVTNYQSGAVASTSGQIPLGTTLLAFDFVHPDLYQALLINQVMIWNGSVITQYDGQAATELGFFLFPTFSAQASATSGGMAAGTYQYIVIYQWYDNIGNLHQSSPSVPVSITIDGATNTSVDLTINPLNITAKQGTRSPVLIAIFRTDANGTVFHRVNDTVVTINNTPFATISYNDGQPDAQIDSFPLPYTTGGVLDNIIPPPGLQMTIYNNRMWLVDSEMPTTVWYSKTVTPGVGLSFSDLLTANIDQRQGEITALGAFDDKIVFFKKTVPFFSVGDGANDLGLSSSLSLPQIVASDVGCKASKSVLLNMPQGIMFQSDKGIYVIDRALQAQYIGKDVEAYNSQTIVSANLIDAKSQIRFLCSDGVALVYDYIYGQWSTFTNHLGYGADIWQGNYTYCRVDGDIYTETPGVFIDKTTAISLKIGTAWIKLTEVQNFERLRRLFVIGDYKSPHLLNGQVFFDYEATETTAAAFQFDPQAVLGLHGDDSVYQFRYHLERQKCESARFVISDDFTGLTPGEGYSLSQLSIEAGLKQGGNKLSPYKSVG